MLASFPQGGKNADVCWLAFHREGRVQDYVGLRFHRDGKVQERGRKRLIEREEEERESEGEEDSPSIGNLHQSTVEYS
jgi:hypothetical protein